jgi:hypothetical protein
MGSGQQSTLTGQQSTRVGSNWVGWAGYGLGFGSPRGRLWLCHVVVVGLNWAVVHGLWSMVDQETLVHGPQTGLRWTKSTLSFLRRGPRTPVARAGCRRGEFSPISCRRASVGDVITGELPQRFRRLIEVGKSLLAPWRLRWWGRSGGWGFIGSQPR